MDHPPSTAHPPQTDAMPPRRSRRIAWLAACIALLTMSCLSIVLFMTSLGWQALASAATLLSGGIVKIQQPHGRLADGFGARNLRVSIPHGAHFEIERWNIAWQPLRLLNGMPHRVQIDRLQADILTWTPGPAQPPTVPASLSLPFALQLDHLQLTTLRVGDPSQAKTVLSRLSARLRTDGDHHRIEHMRAEMLGGMADAEVSLSGIQPFAVDGRLNWNGTVSGQAARFAGACIGPLQHGSHCKIDLSSSHGSGRADFQLLPFREAPLRHLQLNLSGVDPAAWRSGLPNAKLSLQARIDRAENDVDRLIGTVQLRNAAAAPLDRQGLPLAAADAQLDWKTGRLHLAALNLNLGDAARLQGQLTLDTKVPTDSAAHDARSANTKPEQTDQAGSGSTAAPFAVDARFDVAALDLSKIHSKLLTSSAQGNIALKGTTSALTLHAALDDPRAALRLRATVQEERADIEQLQLKSGPSLLEAGGRLVWAESAPPAGLSSADKTGKKNDQDALRSDLQGRAEHFDPARFGRFPTGDINVAWQIAGRLPSLPASRLDFEFRSAPSQWNGAPFELRAAGNWVSPSDGSQAASNRDRAGQPAPSPRIVIQHGVLRLAGNQLQIDGAFGQRDDRLDFILAAPALDTLAALLAPLIAQGGLPTVGGRIDASGSISGTLDRPQARINLNADHLRFGNWQLAEASGNLALSDHLNKPDGSWSGVLRTGALLQKADSDAAPPAQSRRLDLTTASKTVGRSRLDKASRWRPVIDELAVSLKGRRSQHRMNLFTRLTQGAHGRLVVDGGLRDDGQWNGQLTSASITHSGDWDGLLQGPAPLSAGPAGFSIQRLDWNGNAGRLRLDELRHEAKLSASRGSIEALEVRPWLRVAGLGEQLGGDLRLNASWNLQASNTDKAAGPVQGQLRIVRQSGDLVALGSTPRLLEIRQFDLNGETGGTSFNLALTLRSAVAGTVSGQAMLPLRLAQGLPQLAVEAPLSANLILDIPSLGWLGVFGGDHARLDGRLRADLRVDGNAASPRWNGTIQGEQLALQLPDTAVSASQGVLSARFDRTALLIDTLQFNAKPTSPPPEAGRTTEFPRAAADQTGTLRIAGRIDLNTLSGMLDYQAERLPLIQRSDLWLIGSGKGSFGLDADRVFRLQGDWIADAGWLTVPETSTPRLSDDVSIAGRSENKGSATQFAIDLNLDFGRSVFFSGRGLKTRLGGNLKLGAPAGGKLRAIGAVTMHDGRYTAYGQNLQLERGGLNFQGPLDNPGLNILALRPNLPLSAGIQVSGSARQPRVRLWSDPDMPDYEKLSWVVLGRAPDASGSDTGLLIQAAQSLLGGEGESPIKRITQAVGLDEVSVGTASSDIGPLQGSTVARSSSMSSSTVAEQVVSIGKRLGPQTVLAYEHLLSGTGYVVKLTHQLARGISVVLRTGNEQAVSLQYSRTFR